MKQFSLLFFLLFSVLSFSQEAKLAQNYFNKGEYEKAMSYYKKLQEEKPYNTLYTKKLLSCYQQLKQYDKALLLIKKQQLKFKKHTYLLVELGYNYQLSKQETKAEIYYKEALNSIDKQPNYGATIARTFHANFLYKYALEAYKKVMKINPKANYNLQIAGIYGDKGDIEGMFNSFLNMVAKDPRYVTIILRKIGQYTTNDSQNKYNLLIKKEVLKRSQNNPNDVWNTILSWLFIQQKEYPKALIQEKALFARNQESTARIKELGILAFQDKDYKTAQKCFNFIAKSTQNQDAILNAKMYLLKISAEINPNIQEVEQQFKETLNTFGKTAQTIAIQVAFANFLTFQKKAPEQAITLLKEALKNTANKFQKAAIKIQLGDAYVFDSKFNQALIYYSQVQTTLRNHPLAQKARFKVAQTSYYKGDFKWAQTQLKILKGATSQLISNNALDLSLLISDNIAGDTLQIALKHYAKADILAFQQKNEEAITALDAILKDFKGHAIEDETLFKQAQLYIKTNQFTNAENNLIKLIAINKEDILVDDAIYSLAELYANKLDMPTKASKYYEKIIFEFPSSIYLVSARNKFRKLRGDILN